MTILLLGKDGQLGWELQRTLAPHGDLVTCGRAECDLSDLTRLRALVRRVAPTVIVNAAAYTAVDKAESEPELAMRINAEVPQVLAELAQDGNMLLIHYSTDYVFDGCKATPYDENDVPNPQNVYGRSKLAGEEAIRAAGAKSLIFRTSWVFGAHGGNFVKTILRLARERQALRVVADQIGSPTPAELIATVTGIVLGMLRRGAQMLPGEQRLYHLCCGRPVSWHEFARSIVTLAGGLPAYDLRLTAAAIEPIPGHAYPTPAIRPANSRLECARLENDFGLRMPDWQPYLERMLQQLSDARNAA